MSLSWTLFREVPWEKFSHWEKLHNSALISKVISKSFNHKIKIILKKSACVPIHNLLIIVCVCVCVCNCEVILTTTYRILGNKMQHAQSILMPLCLPVLTPRMLVRYIPLSLKAEVGVVPGSTSSLFSPICLTSSMTHPLPHLTVLLASTTFFYWPQENTSPHSLHG